MAYDFFGNGNSDSQTTLSIDGPTVELPDASFVRDAAIVRDGMDLVLDGPNGTVTVEGYFSASDAPDLVTPEGYTLSPELVDSFARSPAQYAQAQTFNDVSPVGAVDEVTGDATITRMNGSIEPITLGTSVYQGDVIETSTDGAVNVSFIDETSFAVSEEARLAIDEYVFDPMTEAGTQNFSVLKGMFVFTSGLIGRDDPDDVNIDTPSGSIGIRGTIIAGNVDTGEITVVEGAIVVRDLAGNEVTLDQQFETAFMPASGGVENMGLMSAKDMAERFEPVSRVAPTLFSSINDAMAEQAGTEAPVEEPKLQDQPVDGPEVQPGEDFDANGSVDQNNDSKVDGTVDEGAAPVEGTTDDTTGETSGDSGEVVAPKPAPMMQTGQMGTDPMGTNTGGMTTTTTTQTATHTASGAYATTAMKAPPPPPSGTTQTLNAAQDPSTIVAPVAGTNHAPLHILSHIGGAFDAGQVNIAPSNPGGVQTNYFRVGSNQNFEYFFDQEFADQDGGPMAIQLSSASRNALNANFGPEGSGWSFGTNGGHLTIFDTGTITSNFNIAIEVLAIDNQGATSLGGFQSYALQAYTSTTLANNTIVDGQVMTGTIAGDILNIGTAPNGADNNRIFLGNGPDNITLVRGQGNDIHLGSGDNEIWIQNIAANGNNNVYGGMNNDTFDVENFNNNRIFGLDGDDKVTIDLANLGLLASATGVIDLGHSSFRAGNELRANSISYEHAVNDTGGYGDTLYIEGSGGALDFSSSVNSSYFRGIERIDTNNAGTNALVTMTYNDVIQMTDYKNTLIFRADTSDQLTFTGGGFGGMTKVGEDITLDDNYDGNGNGVFDVWTDGNVTLIVEDVGAIITGLP